MAFAFENVQRKDKKKIRNCLFPALVWAKTTKALSYRQKICRKDAESTVFIIYFFSSAASENCQFRPGSA